MHCADIFCSLCFGILVFANFEIGFLKDPPSISHSNFDGGKLTVERGLTGIYSFSYFGKRLQAKSERNADPPVGLRLTSSGDDRNRYVLKFVGYREGLFDLGNLIEHVDGLAALDLPKLELNVVSMLPKDQRSDLFEAANFKPNLWVATDGDLAY